MMDGFLFFYLHSELYPLRTFISDNRDALAPLAIRPSIADRKENISYPLFKPEYIGAMLFNYWHTH
jgi:hypothetical protein